MAKVIYAIYVNTGIVGECLDTIRLIASPTTKRFSHLTVRGPYDSDLDDDFLAALNSKIKPNSIYIDGSGNFFKEGQNTVFFTCHGEGLKDISNKVDYELFIPHVTIYDSEDRKFAEAIYEVVNRYNYNVRCGADTLVKFELGNGGNGLLGKQISMDNLRSALGFADDFPRQIENMVVNDRLSWIGKICKYLSQIGES